MDQASLTKVIYSLFGVIIIFIISSLCKNAARKTQQNNKINKNRYFAIKRLISIFSFFCLIVIIVFIWGINIKDLWISVTSVVAMIAVAFFAVWSLIGNILAGIIIYFTTPFKINDTIEILPDGMKGKVLGINTFFTVLVEEDQSLISIPNSLLFQKYIRKYKK